MSNFDYYAAYYDLLYQDKDYAGEVNYVHNLITRHAGPATSILDFGCGTGQHDLLLAAHGYQVTGVDLSANMIARANQLKPASALVEFVTGDIRHLRLKQTYTVVTCLFHVINYQVTNHDLQATFATARAHLAPRGLFIFDAWYGPGVLTDQPTRRVKEIQNERIWVERIAEPIWQINQNLVEVHYALHIKDKINQTSQQFTEVHRMRYLFYPEIEMLAQEHNFEIVAFEKWLTGGPPGFDWLVTVVCKLKD